MATAVRSVSASSCLVSGPRRLAAWPQGKSVPPALRSPSLARAATRPALAGLPTAAAGPVPVRRSAPWRSPSTASLHARAASARRTPALTPAPTPAPTRTPRLLSRVGPHEWRATRDGARRARCVRRACRRVRRRHGVVHVSCCGHRSRLSSASKTRPRSVRRHHGPRGALSKVAPRPMLINLLPDSSPFSSTDRVAAPALLHRPPRLLEPYWHTTSST